MEKERRGGANDLNQNTSPRWHLIYIVNRFISEMRMGGHMVYFGSTFISRLASACEKCPMLPQPPSAGGLT